MTIYPEWIIVAMRGTTVLTKKNLIISCHFKSHAHFISLGESPTPASPDVLGLQFPEILAGTASREGFWELESKNLWGPKVGNHLTRFKKWFSVV